MTISQKYPNLRQGNVLFIVLGRQVGRFYYSQAGQVEELDAFEIETPQYTDREGHFMRSGHGQLYGWGSVYENKKGYIENKFLHSLHDRLHVIAQQRSIERFYLFAPEHLLPQIQSSLPVELRDKLAGQFTGNFLKQPLPALFDQIINAGAPDPAVPRPEDSAEAQAILQRVGAQSLK